MNAQDLKNSILQLAVQGKLVEQRTEEGTARELLEQIKLEKDQLIKDKKIKKSKPMPEITEDEIPFEIPESWEWVRLEDICTKLVDGDHNPPKGVDEKTDYIMASSTNINNNTIVDIEKVRYLTQDIFEKENERTQATDGDIFFTSVGTLGRSCVYKGGYNICFQRSVSVIRTLILNYYLKYTFDSAYFQYKIIREATGTAQKGFYLKQLAMSLIPIPPLEEQHRIVAKIEEILPYIDKYDKAYTKLETFNKKFPEDMKKSILQLAMQGKLVEQRPEEGTADEQYEQIVAEKAQLIKDGKIKKEKPLPEITEDEIPFEIPASWKWVRLSAICEKIGSGSTPTGGKNVYQDDGILFLRSQNVYNDGLRFDGIAFISEELNRPNSVVVAKDILLNITGGSIGRCALVPDDFDKANINQHVMIIRLVNLNLRFWVHFVIISAYIQQKIMDVQVGVSREGLSAEKLKNFIIPLPPLAEQKRIVAKIEELLPYCDQLIKC